MIRITDTAPQCCAAEAPLKEAMARLNASAHLFQVVVDGDGRVLGTLTDGDVRRAILGGVALEAPVSEATHRTAILGRLGDDVGNRAKLKQIPAMMAFMPVVDDAGRLAEIWVSSAPDEDPGLALVMAGGFGRRLGEKTREVPKPLLPVGGRAILDQVLDGLRAAGFQQVYVSVHYLSDCIERHLAKRPDAASIVALREDRPLGTAGAIAHVPGREHENLLVINADLLTRVDLSALLAFHRRYGHEATVATAHHETEIPFGVVRRDAAGKVQGVEEKPVIRDFVLAGIYYLSPTVTALVSPGQHQDMPAVINQACKVGRSVGIFPLHEYWRDIGRPIDLERAETDHAALPPVFREVGK